MTANASDKECGDEARLNVEDLSAAGVFPYPVERIELRETHISQIVLTGPFAYKIKKAVRFDFIDTSTLELRRHLCEEELRLNRRLAPDLYLDVVAITRDVSGRLRFGGEGLAIEYAVRMRQFDPSQELHALLEKNAVGLDELRALATRLADFHRNASIASASEPYGSMEQTRAMVLGTLATLLKQLPADEGVPELDRLSAWIHAQLRQFEDVLGTRKEAGAVRECHGDLHARNIVHWQQALMPFDCLEFDPTLRWIDVMNDVAFLVMDLASYRRGDLAFAFLSSYLEAAGDYEGVRLMAFYAVYRALVRAMVDALNVASDREASRMWRGRLHARIRAATQWSERRSQPFLIIMHGPSGSGKSWLSERLVPLLSAVRIRSDLERKRLAGLEPLDSASTAPNTGIYEAQFIQRTYARLLDCAESCLQGGINTVVDAAFLEEVDRRLFYDLAARLGVRYLILSCTGEQSLLRSRIEARRQQGADPSDASVEILAEQLQRMRPPAEYEQTHLISISVGAPDVLSFALSRIDQRLRQHSVKR